VTAAVFLLLSAGAAVRWLPASGPPLPATADPEGFLALLGRRELRRTFLVAFGAFFVFSSTFNPTTTVNQFCSPFFFLCER
jgi:hypothetical protein